MIKIKEPNDAALQQITAVCSLPPDLAEKILRARDAMLDGDHHEAYHWLYKIADHECSKFNPWEELERVAGRR